MSFASPARVSRISGGSLEAIWNGTCAELKYSAEQKAAGWDLLQKLDSKQDKLGDQGTQAIINGQVASVAFFISSKGKQYPGVSLLQLTDLLSMNLKDFFSHADENHARLYPGVELSEIVPVKRAMLTSTITFSKWKDFSRTLFPSGFAGATAESQEANVKLAFELGWLLYALAKCHMATGATDPLSAYHLLAAIIHLLLALIPEEAQTSGVFWTKLGEPISGAAPTYPFPQHAQDTLWEHTKAVPAEVAKQQPTVAALLDEVAAIFGLSNLHNGGVLSPDGGTKLRALLAPGTLSRTVESVKARYAAVWPDKSQLDDAFYLLPQSANAPTRAAQSPATSPTRHATHASSASQSVVNSPGGSARSSLLTPLRRSNPMTSHGGAGVPQTPMSSQLESVGWLQRAVQGAESSGAKLAKYYDACEASPKEAIDGRVKTLCTQVEESLLASELSAEIGEQLALGQKLYYKMLLSFLEAEERRLKHSNFSALLSNASFHTSLLACCLESVFASYSTSGMTFPAILRTLDLQPFDFGKVIESFIKHEPHLPSHLRIHFADVEAKIVEQLAWQEGSPLHALMAEYDASLKAEAAGTESPGAEKAAGAMRARAALEQFVRKCLFLGAKRIQDMCLRLLLQSSLVQQVWEVVKLVLDQARHLLVGRHLDQLLMCSIYGVCKVNQKHVTFRHIIEQYKRQQGASPRTFREVRMRSSDDPPNDIIQFYNLVFIPAMKDHLLRVCTAAAGTAGVAAPAATAATAAPTSGVSAAATGPSAGSMTHLSPDLSAARGGASPRHVSVGGARDVYVSNYTPNSHMSPTTRIFYAFPDTPAAAADAGRLKDINTHINAPAGSDVAHTLSAMSNGAPSSAPQQPEQPRLDLAGGGSGVVASGLKRNRAMLGAEPSRSSTPGNSSADGDGVVGSSQEESASNRSRSA